MTLMARDSRFYAQLCALVASACDACAAECERFDDALMRACAEACKRAAGECRQLAG